MHTYWNFPATVGGTITSYSNAGLETFRGNPLKSLTREIIQNSLDAIRDTEQPVVVEFNSFEIDSNQFPGRIEMVKNFQLCKDTWRGSNEKIEGFIGEGLEILTDDKINFLRISDFNTKGLEGAKDGRLGSPWSSLVREEGSSNKKESSGGSFGIGKAAPFLNSKLRTLFYSSYDMTHYESHIGVSKIMSFNKPNHYIATGDGYYTYNEHSPAIPGQLTLDETFQRKETGTDIFVSAFEPQSKWKEVIKEAVLFDFFIPIFRGKLVVKINDFEINHSNIAELIEKLDDKKDNETLKMYFSLLSSDKAIKKVYPSKSYRDEIHFEEGETTLYLMNGDNLNRRVLMTRKTGMRLFEQTHISGSISFTGILTVTGPNMNDIFKEMENPEHNQWDHDRYEKNPNLAKQIYADLRKFLRDTVREQFQEIVKDEIDAFGLNDFLPNKNLISEDSQAKVESLGGTVKSLIKKEKDHKPKEKHKRRRRGLDSEDIDERLAGDFGITAGDLGGHGDGKHHGGGSGYGASITNPGGDNEIDPNQDGELKKERVRRPSKKPVSIDQRYFCVNKEEGQYRFNIKPNKTMDEGRLVFRVVGEQSDYDVPIKFASTNDSDVTVGKVTANTVYLGSLRKNKKFLLDVGIDYPNYCVLEVELYES